MACCLHGRLCYTHEYIENVRLSTNYSHYIFHNRYLSFPCFMYIVYVQPMLISLSPALYKVRTYDSSDAPRFIINLNPKSWVQTISFVARTNDLRLSWHCNRGRGNLVTVLSRTHGMPLRNRNTVWLKHARPVTRLVRTGSVLSENNSANKIIFTLGVVIPNGDNKTGSFQLLGCDVKADGLVKYWIKRVFFERRFLGFYWLLKVHQRYLYEGICKQIKRLPFLFKYRFFSAKIYN